MNSCGIGGTTNVIQRKAKTFMKKEIMIAMALAAVLVGCKDQTQSGYNEPSGAERSSSSSRMEQGTSSSTNTLSEPSGAGRIQSTNGSTGSSGTSSGSSTDQGASQQGTSGSQQQPQSGTSNP
jgi:hypothetical protein